MIEWKGFSIDEHGLVKEERSSYASTLEDRLIAFAVSVCTVAERLPANRAGNHVANQIIRSGTSPAPNNGEAQGAESRRDFVHKLKVCLKELREPHVWLKFIKRMNLACSTDLEQTLKEADELIAIFVRSILTAQHNIRRKAPAGG